MAERGVGAEFVGHPLSDLVRIETTREAFFHQHGFSASEPLVAVLPGSREGEAIRHFPALQDAVARMADEGARQFVLPVAPTAGRDFFARSWQGPPVRFLENQTADGLGHADVGLVASGTATIEAAILGTPMVTFYRLAWPSYQLARHLVDVPFYSMVNILAGKPIVPECMQQDCTGAKLATETLRLVRMETARCRMTQELAQVRDTLCTEVPASERAAEAICDRFGLPGQ